MRYIVLDLEWNQPLSYNSAAYKAVGGRLLFEMIQIGAIMLNEQGEVIDQFTQLIAPTHYIKLHPRIKRITQIEQEDLAGAPAFEEAIKLFSDWCGTDYRLLTWGCDDISVLWQNLEFFGCEEKLGPFFDIQRAFGEVVGKQKDRTGLKSAMAHFEIEPSDTRAFHNALNDAYYTAQVFLALPDREMVFKYPQSPKKLTHTERKKGEKSAVVTVESEQSALSSPAACRPMCPVCGKKLLLAEGFVPQGAGKYTALCDCPVHGLLFVKLTFSRDESGACRMARTVALSDEQSKAYVRTKHLQWKNKLASRTDQA